jgi:signal transduction histidine kinase
MLADVPDPLPKGARQQVQRVVLSARHLIQLIDEILTFSRIEAGRERITLEDVAVQELVDEVSAIVEPLAREKDLDFAVAAPSEHLVLQTDPGKVRQILLNLVGNAVKFTEKGGIRFEATRDATHIRFAVQDTGIGIAPRDQARIFDPFWQVEQAASRRGGTGLGLTVAHEFAHMLGGELHVESEPGRGTIFTLELPIRSAGADQPTEKDGRAPADRG